MRLMTFLEGPRELIVLHFISQWMDGIPAAGFVDMSNGKIMYRRNKMIIWQRR